MADTKGMNDLDILKNAAMHLEADMRRYIFDKTPDRRRMCLEAYRERLGLNSWAEAQQEESEARRRLYEANETNGD